METWLSAGHLDKLLLITYCCIASNFILDLQEALQYILLCSSVVPTEQGFGLEYKLILQWTAGPKYSTKHMSG